MKEANATFYSFKRSGKWKYSGRGHLSADVFKVFTREERRAQILADNDGKLPGLSGPGVDLVWVVIGDENVEHGYYLMLYPNPEFA